VLKEFKRSFIFTVDDMNHFQLIDSLLHPTTHVPRNEMFYHTNMAQFKNKN